ncbi:grasp-with-spasm system ATP-grasp peptide maturase [Tannerella forsythia]|uniref:grasp-with-spasm system ATP-grasp peptide maturase n=1 Tax=Tannerella forsythia TaxID=28112 RepID=UPI00062B04B6|nr:grasp-with-spasm system ATP-grasp peptide maturase [Tannerella forsythia]TPE15068.1 grasp-with-spasm system ATP-grasp peptide maturase [Tannerella forsythia]
MVLILSNYGDYSSDIVMDHIKILGGECIRVNSFDLLNDSIKLSINDDFLECNGRVIDPQKIGSVWFRKFGFFRKSPQYQKLQRILEPTAQSYIATEFSKIIEAFEYYFRSSFWLTDPRNIALNKFVVLKQAQRVGLLVPATYVVNRLEKLIEIRNIEGDLISKSIYDPLVIYSKGKNYSMYTTLIEEEDLCKMPDSFLPSMVQKAIPKQFEVRVFFLMGECFSMAIMSQDDENTETDYRKYNFDNPNRFLPFQLPKNIEDKVVDLMAELSLNTGSIDFILTPENEYIFLEVNPTGQFGMVDYSCNYGLHEKVANILIAKDKEYHEKIS